MRTVWIWLALSGCGGIAIAPGESSDTGASVVPVDAGLPDVGTPACDRQDNECVLCNDDRFDDAGVGAFHCGPNVVQPQCPKGTEVGASCNPNAFMFDACIACAANGTGYMLSCFDPIPHWNQASTFSCSL